MIQMKLTEPSMVKAVMSGIKKQVTAQVPVDFVARDNNLVLSYRQDGTEQTIGTAKIQSVAVINGGVVPVGSSYNDAEDWARAEGFESFWDACKWYTKKYGAGWQNNVWGVIQFEGNWVRGD